MVLAHLFYSLGPLAFSRRHMLAFCVLLISSLSWTANAQVVQNGQTYTQGLAIINSPAASSSMQVGSTMRLSIEVSGNGKMPINPSGSDTRLTSLDIYLISESTASNITVARSSLLNGEEGSSVKHVDFTVPSCAAPGSYQLTVYEGSVIDGKSYFSITPIPIRITTPRPGGKPCSTIFNNIQQVPQESSPPPTQPWLGSSNPKPSASSSSPGTASTSTADESNTASSSTSSTRASTGNSSTQVSTDSDTTVAATLTEPSSTSTSNPVETSSAVTSTSSSVDVSATPTSSGDVVTVTKVVSSVHTETVIRTREGTTELATTTIVSTSTVVEAVKPGSTNFFQVNAAGSIAPCSLTVLILAFAGVLPLMSTW